MPLTETSKSKVSLASLSASTAAAAESLWSRSKKISKRRQKPTVDPTPEVTPCDSSTSIPVVTDSLAHLPLQQQLQERQEFRRKFLEGLQFYCENSSLILNSDLPADLIEFVTSHGFSVESLGIILELKKSSAAFQTCSDTKPVTNKTVLEVTASTDKPASQHNFTDSSRKLLQHWMSADSCAEAFVSLSLEEVPGVIAERILFAVPDHFHLYGEDFLNFLLVQLLLAIRAIVFGLKTTLEPQSVTKDVKDNGADETPLKINTQVLSTFLDRIITRYYSDAEHFYSLLSDRKADNCFQDFVVELTKLCDQDTIARRLVSKIFLRLGSHSAAKLVKIIFSSGAYEDKKIIPSTLLWPAFEFVSHNSHWKFVLQTLPVKTVTKSRRFWFNWAEYIQKEFQHFPEFWHKSVAHWIILNKSTLVDAHSLYSTSMAITALARIIKHKINYSAEQDEISNYIHSLEPSKILQNIVHSLESINEDKRGCGMALGQIVADLQFHLLLSKDDSKKGGDPKKLKFECTSKMFTQLIEFYECTNLEDLTPLIPTKPQKSQKIEILDSDDDNDPEENLSDDMFPTLEEKTEEISEIGIDPRILTLRARKRKIPMYFSEILETLLEKAKNEDEAEILQMVVVLKIPVLLFAGVKIDAKMATTIARCLSDLEDGGSIEIPVLLALFELFMQHPFEVADVLGEVSFNGNHYALGQRLMNLERLTRIVQLSSKQSCYNCYAGLVGKHQKELLGIYPEFINKYLHSRMKLRICQDCRSSGIINMDEEFVTSEAMNSKHKENDNEPLTWRQIVDKRVAAKTRYFVTPRSKTVITVPDEYSSKLLPILWSSIANRLTSNTAFYVNVEERQKSGNMHDIFVVKTFHYLARCLLGTSGPNCPHLRNLSAHVGELVSNFFIHEDTIARRAVLSLLGVALSVGEGKLFVVEALSSQGNILQTVDRLIYLEQDAENLRFLNQIQQCLASYTTVGLLQELSLSLE